MKKVKVMLITNIISPYRIPLFNQISRYESLEFKVISLAEKESNRSWKINKKLIEFDYQILSGWHTFIWQKELPLHLNKGLAKVLQQSDPDVVITSGYDSLAYWEAFLYCKLRRKKFILWNGTTLFSTGSIDGIVGRLKKFIIKSADGYIAYGTMAKQYLKALGADSDSIYVSINTVDVQYFRNAVLCYRSRKDFDKERGQYSRLMLLYTGQLISRKGLSHLLMALDQLNDHEVGLFIIGSGPEEGKLKDFCTKKDLKNIFFEGFQQQEILPKYYALADALIMPSLEEVWGLVANEALASGLYVLSSYYAGASHDLINKEWNGSVLTLKSIEELAELIVEIKENIGLLRSRRDDISRRACQEFSISKSAQAFQEAIQSVIK